MPTASNAVEPIEEAAVVDSTAMSAPQIDECEAGKIDDVDDDSFPSYQEMDEWDERRAREQELKERALKEQPFVLYETSKATGKRVPDKTAVTATTDAAQAPAASEPSAALAADAMMSAR